jgi:uncharacterized membrane protein YjjB (DUF3815 family)
MIGTMIAAFLGTIAFALLFGVPRQYYVYCGGIGAAGWLVYSLLMEYVGATAPVATFVATVVVILLSRYAAVWESCPSTVFLVTGIFPLVPGGGIYWTSYYLVTNQLRLALQSGFAAVKVAIAIVLGIVFVFELPYSFFRVKKRKEP